MRNLLNYENARVLKKIKNKNLKILKKEKKRKEKKRFSNNFSPSHFLMSLFTKTRDYMIKRWGELT
jgi:hypothetical protein